MAMVCWGSIRFRAKCIEVDNYSSDGSVGESTNIVRKILNATLIMIRRMAAHSNDADDHWHW